MLSSGRKVNVSWDRWETVRMAMQGGYELRGLLEERCFNNLGELNLFATRTEELLPEHPGRELKPIGTRSGESTVSPPGKCRTDGVYDETKDLDNG
ncbi:hypothetical protein HDU93_006105, partial [Gonapodya sp. JEL0774]